VDRLNAFASQSSRAFCVLSLVTRHSSL
jgi:hypothetical protein